MVINETMFYHSDAALEEFDAKTFNKTLFKLDWPDCEVTGSVW